MTVSDNNEQYNPEQTHPCCDAVSTTESPTPMSTDMDNEELPFDDQDDDDGGEEAAELYEHYRVVADKGQQLLRVDKFLLDHLKDTSRHRIQMAARRGVHSCQRQTGEEQLPRETV